MNVELLVRAGLHGVFVQNVEPPPPAGAAYVPSARKKLVVPPPVVSATQLNDVAVTAHRSTVSVTEALPITT